MDWRKSTTKQVSHVTKLPKSQVRRRFKLHNRKNKLRKGSPTEDKTPGQGDNNPATQQLNQGKRAVNVATSITPDLTLRRLGWQNEPDPTMPSINPFTQARNLSGLKQNEIAEALAVEVTEIIRLEQAVFGHVPDKYVEYYTVMLSMPEGWEAGYRTFQKLLRRSASRSIHGVWKMPPGELTFRRFRIYNWPTMSQTGWCKAFCVHPAALYAVEKSVKTRVPLEIMKALVEANIMSDDQVKRFAGRLNRINEATAEVYRKAANSGRAS